MPAADLAKRITERQRVLKAWEGAMRELTPEPRTTFLARQTVVDDLAEFSDVELAAAAASARRGDVLKLEWWLAAAKEARMASKGVAVRERPARRAMRRRESAGARGETGFLRSRDGLMPQRPVDWRLAKRIGPVQNYGDDS
jgi:hypothetical protein